jgi:sugar phosphate isomerase/epimerase
VAAPGIPNEYALSTSCFGARLPNIQDQIFAAVGMGFRRIELGLTDSPPGMDGLNESCAETGTELASMVAGCRDTQGRDLPAIRLASLDEDERMRALSSVKRHARLAMGWGCRRLIVRGSRVEDAQLAREARALEAEALEDGVSPELREKVGAFVTRVQVAGHKQLEHFCRSLHEVMNEYPELHLAIEPGQYIDDLLGFDAMGWVLDDLKSTSLGYWHDVGRIHLRQRQGLPPQGAWLDQFGARMVGIHLQDAAADETAMPVGLGEVDFKLVKEYLPEGAERVLELHHRHGRAELLSSISQLVAHGI